METIRKQVCIEVDNKKIDGETASRLLLAINKSKYEVNSFDEAVRPLMKWLAEKCHPHTKCIVESNVAELVEGVKSVVTDEYLVD